MVARYRTTPSLSADGMVCATTAVENARNAANILRIIKFLKSANGLDGLRMRVHHMQRVRSTVFRQQRKIALPQRIRPLSRQVTKTSTHLTHLINGECYSPCDLRR